MSLLSCSRFSGWIPIWSMDTVPRNPSYSASFSPLIFLLHYPFLISLYLWLNMYFSKDADSVPTFESPWIHRGWTPAPDHLICLLRNQYAGQEATVRTRHGTTDWFKIGKGVWQGCILSFCLLNFYAEYIMWNAGLDESQPGIKIAGRNINNLRLQMTPL